MSEPPINRLTQFQRDAIYVERTKRLQEKQAALYAKLKSEGKDLLTSGKKLF